MVLACREFPGRQLCKVLRLLCRQQSFFGRSHVITYVILLSRKLCKKASIVCPINKQSEFSFTHGSILVDLFQVCCLCFCLLQAKKKEVARVLFFLGAFAKLREVTISFVMSVRVYAWINSAPSGRIFVEFYSWVFFEHLSRRFKLYWNLTRITSTLHEELFIYVVISR